MGRAPFNCFREEATDSSTTSIVYDFSDSSTSIVNDSEEDEDSSGEPPRSDAGLRIPRGLFSCVDSLRSLISSWFLDDLEPPADVGDLELVDEETCDLEADDFDDSDFLDELSCELELVDGPVVEEDCSDGGSGTLTAPVKSIRAEVGRCFLERDF
jgi:hypothetical protein